MKKMKKNLLLGIMISFIINLSFAQNDTTEVVDFLDMDLEALMNVEVESASKKKESIFDAPLAVTVLSAFEIKNSGATSIPELLRLVPGIIVREKTNGNYDVHIRGNENATGLVSSVNKKTLVMIDNRIVYNYFQGGTFWETLPISVDDIEKIELIRGASSALYGPNAVTGVINIITKKAKTDEKIHVNANMQAGTFNSKIASASASYGSEKFGIIASGNYSHKDRFQEDYYIFEFDRYAPRDSMWLYTVNGRGGPSQIIDSAEVMARYSDINKSTHNYGVNISTYYNLNNDIKFNLSTGMQNSDIQTVHLGQKISSMNNRISDSKYINFHADIHDLTSNISYLNGVQDINVGAAGFKYDMDIIDLNLEYNYEIKGVTIRPGVSYQQATYNDLPYNDTTIGEGFIRAKKSLTNIAPLLRAEYTLFEKLRIIVAGRYDMYNTTDKGYIGYQFASTYKLNNNNLLRFVASKSNTSPNITNTYFNLEIPLMPPHTLNLKGNPDLKLTELNMLEIGIRSRIKEKLIVDLEIFNSTVSNLGEFITTEWNHISFQPAGPMGPTVHDTLPATALFSNLDRKTQQSGATINFNYIHSTKLQISAFGTFQMSKFIDYNVNPDDSENAVAILEDIDSEYTPSFYGGFSLNIVPIQKLNVNINSYFYDAQRYGLYNQNLEIENPEIIDPKLLLNARVSYKVWKNNSVFINARNILNSTNKEFIYSDDNGMMILGGINLIF